MYIYLCRDEIEDIFTAIYNIYEDKHNLPDTGIMLNREQVLFAEFISVEPDQEKAAKVIRTIRRQFGEENAHYLFMALSGTALDKAQAVYKTISYGLENKVKPGHLFDHLTDPNILQAFKLGRNASRESQHLKGFLRFQELEKGILLACIKPKNHILGELMEHFSDRFPSENFMILDEGRQLFGIHKSREQWFLADAAETGEIIKKTTVSEKERYYSELFCHFCKSIGIQERKNTALQRNMLPLRFRPYMTEFREQVSK